MSLRFGMMNANMFLGVNIIMTVTRDKKNGYYQYEFMYRGVRYHRRFKDATRDEVIGYETIAKAELRKSGYDIAAENYHVYTLSEIMEDYKQYADDVYASPKEAKVVVDNFYKIVGNKPLKQIIVSDIEKYRTQRKKAGVKNSSINREMNNIKKMFSLAKSNHKIKESPCSGLRPLRIVNPTKRFLEKEEEKKLLDIANPLMKAFIIISIQSGMRMGEILNLKWSDVYMKQGYMIALNTKNGKPRKLLITPDIKEQLELFYNSINEYVFTNPLTHDKYKNVDSSFIRLVKKSGIKHITFHELRHTTASRMNEMGIDLATIQEYLDHKDPRTTRRYIHKPRKNILDAVQKLSQYTITT